MLHPFVVRKKENRLTPFNNDRALLEDVGVVLAPLLRMH